MVRTFSISSITGLCQTGRVPDATSTRIAMNSSFLASAINWTSPGNSGYVYPPDGAQLVSQRIHAHSRVVMTVDDQSVMDKRQPASR
jgi:hypothetical protein